MLEQDFQEFYHLDLRRELERHTWGWFYSLVKGLLSMQPHVITGLEKVVIVQRTRVARFLKG